MRITVIVDIEIPEDGKTVFSPFLTREKDLPIFKERIQAQAKQLFPSSATVTVSDRL
jgi:hypothetical protein